MARMRHRLAAPVLVGVGAAFDFHAGLIPQAPGWMQRLGLEWAFRLAQEPRRLWRRYLRYNPRFVVGFARQWARARLGLRRLTMPYDVSVIGLGRVGLPLALAFADAGLRVLGIDKDADRLEAVRSQRMPFKEPGTDELLSRAPLDVSARATDAAESDAIVLTLGTPTFSHIEIDLGEIRSVLDDLLPVLRDRASCSCCARPSRPARPSSWPATWRRSAASTSARTCSSRTCPSGSPPTASWRRSARSRASSAASAKAPASGPGGCSTCSARRSCRPRRCRPSWRRSGPTSCATRRSRSRTC